MMQLPEEVNRRENRPFKSGGENRVTMNAPGNMTDTEMIFHAVGRQTNGAVLITEIIWSRNDASLHHLHRLEDEGFYVIEGSMKIHTSSGEFLVGPGEFAWGPRMQRHAYTIGPDGCRVLLIQTPGTELSSFFRSSARFGEAVQEDLTLDEYFAWSDRNYGIKWFDPAVYPPRQTILDEEYAIATTASASAASAPPDTADRSTTITKQVALLAPAEAVWKALIDPSEFMEWNVNHFNFPDGPPAELAEHVTYREEVTLLGIPGEIDWAVAEYVEGRLIALNGQGSMGSVMRMRYEVHPRGAGSVLELTNQFEGAVLATMETQLAAATNDSLEQSLQNFRAKVESR